MRVRFGIAVIAVMAAVAGCGRPTSQPAPLATVAPLPAPAVPPWISQIAPVGKVKNASQIRVIFASPVLPVEEIGSPHEDAVLSHFHIAPAISGAFIVLTPRMIGFQSDASLPPASRIRVTLTAGLRDLRGNVLNRDLSWTFSTTPLEIALPDDFQTPATAVGLRPVIPVQANAAVDPDELARHAEFRKSDGTSVDVRVQARATPSDEPGNIYDVTPEEDLDKAASYRFIVDSGVMPLGGNTGSSSSLSVDLRTYAPLAFATAVPTADPLAADGNRFAGGDPAFVFNNPLDPQTFATHVHVSPSPLDAGRLLSLSDDGTTVLVNPYALRPQTRYVVSFDENLPDAFGQHLERNVTAVYKTGSLSPYFWAPRGFNTFLAGGNLQLEYSAVNVPGNRYRAAYRVLAPQDVANLATGDVRELLPDLSAWNAFALTATRDREAQIRVPLRDKLGGETGMLAYGARTSERDEDIFTGSVLLTNVGVFAQWFPDRGYVAVQHLDDGTPVGAADIQIYVPRTDPSAPPARVCAQGVTNDAGEFAVDGPALQSCYAQNQPSGDAPTLMAVARKGGDWSYVTTYGWSGLYEYSAQYMDGTWTQGQPISRGTIYSDREMYQPGERGWFTGVCYVLQNGRLRADANAQYSVVLRDPNGNERKLPPQRTNAYATFSFPYDFSKTQALGYYTIVATSPDGAQTTGTFRVAQFRPPNFAVDLKLDRQYAAAGDAVAATGDGRYLFGAPMSGASATLHVTRVPAILSPSGWDDFTFGRQWFWPEEQPDASSDAGSQTLTLDSAGKTATNVNVDAALPYAMTYTVDLEVSDVSNLASSATQSFTALPGNSVIGLRTDYVGTVNVPITGSAIVTDGAGKVQTGERVHVELQKMEYSSVTQLVEGAEAARNQVRYTTVAQTDVTAGSGPVDFRLTAADSGPYRIRANFAGAKGDATATDAQVWITGPGNVSWAQQNPAQLQLKLDKKSYRPGDVATVAVASPYDDADLYLSVVRDRVLYRKLVHIHGAAPKVRVPLDESMFPNAAVEGVLVRRGKPLTHAGVKPVDALVKIGLTPLAMSLDARYLKLRITPQKASLQPQERQTLRVEVLDAARRPVRAQLTIAVVNDAILQLSGYRFPDLTKIVYDTQPISTRFGDNRPNLTLTQLTNTNEKGWGYGGGFLAGAAGTRVRTQFLPLAYFTGAVQTDARGVAHVQFAVPDNLTTWRALIVAATGEAQPRFATGDSTFVTTKPLVTDPLLPQFARPGDRFSGGLLLSNSATSAVDARTQASLEGPLFFSGGTNDRSAQAEQQFQPGVHAWRFAMRAGDAGDASFTTRTALSGGASDAFRVPLQVRDTDVTETAIDAGSTQADAAVPLSVATQGGSVSVELSGSLLAQAAAPAQRALLSDDFPLLSLVAARLSIASSLQAIDAALGTRASGIAPQSAAATAIAHLRRLARTDGGFSFWPDERASDPFGSVQALEAMAQARNAGFDVPAALLGSAKAYVVRVLADPQGALKWCSGVCKDSLRLRALRALAAAGDRRTDFLQSIYAGRARLGVPERVQLALYLQQTPSWGMEAQSLAAELASEVYETGRYENVQTTDLWSGDGVEAQAAYVQLLLARKAESSEVDRALRALIAQACKCGWPGAQNTASALVAIAAYAALPQSTPDFQFTMSVDGKNGGSGTFSSAAQPAKTFVLKNLAGGSHELRFAKTGKGALQYVVTYTYPLSTRSGGRLAGLRASRTIRLVNTPAVIATLDIAPQTSPLAVSAGSVFDVGVTVTTDHPVDRVTIEDPLPAGFEALDTSFQTTAAYYQPLADAWQIDYQQIYADRIVAFAQHLDPGVYQFHYLARSVTPGDFLWPGVRAYLLNAPEQFGRSAFTGVHVAP
ncbi:MAG TPA: Ig-like domain-containing protein [Candidatus Baltobacteraceae bacterium]|jgi:hypothetical protein|nr:Ig-like domain-containing protein [Candidatus Baltobacteraceae bacterium]